MYTNFIYIRIKKLENISPIQSLHTHIQTLHTRIQTLHTRIQTLYTYEYKLCIHTSYKKGKNTRETGQKREKPKKRKKGKKKRQTEQKRKKGKKRKTRSTARGVRARVESDSDNFHPTGPFLGFR